MLPDPVIVHLMGPPHCAEQSHNRGDECCDLRTPGRTTGRTMNEYFRRIAFAEAIAAHKRKPDNPALSIAVRGHDVSVSEICAEMVNDRGVMPDFLARELGLVPPVTFAKGASYLKQYLVLPTLDVSEKE